MRYFPLLVSLALAISGCSGLHIEVPAVHGTELSAAEIPAAADATFFKESPKSYKALLVAEIDSDGNKQALRYAVTKAGNNLQIEVFPTTSFYTLLLFKSDGKTFSLQNATDGTIQTGDVTDTVLRDTFGIALTIDELSAALFGNFGSLVTGDAFKVYHAADQTTAQVTSNNLYADLSFDLKVLKRVLFLDENRQATVSVTYNSFFGDQNQPRNLFLEITKYKTNVALTIKKVAR